MLIPGETFSASYPAVPESISAVRTAITSFAERAEVDSEQLETIRLAVTEAVTNAVVHAYGPDEGCITVSAHYLTDELWLLVSDDGSGLRPRRRSRGLGLGLALIAQLCNDFQILSRGTGGTELRMQFEIDGAGAQAHPRGSVASAISPA